MWLGFEKTNRAWTRADGREERGLEGWAEGYPVSRTNVLYQRSKYLTVSNRPGTEDHGKLANTFEMNDGFGYKVICEVPHYD